MAQLCPRYAELQRGGSGKASQLVLQLVSVDCFDRICEHPERLDGVDPSLRSRAKPVCEQLRPLLEGQMDTVTADYRDTCPEAFQTWTGRTWSTRNHLGFYQDVRRCLERQCAQAEGGQERAETNCRLAADIAEGLGDAQAAARLRERARFARARVEQEWEALSEEEKDARTDRDMKILAKRLREACLQGNQRYCRSLAKYCELEGHPPDVCPAPGSESMARDAGAP